MADDNHRPASGPDGSGTHGDRADAASSAAAAEAGAGPAHPGDAELEGQLEGEMPDEDLASRLQEAEQKLDSYRDQALRAQAEAENTRRRASRDVENAHKYALDKITADLLPVLDSLEKAVEATSQAESAAPLAEGVELSLKLFLSVLEKHGIERIDPAGEPFDPQLHEAMTMMPSDYAEPNSVLEVMQPGYVLNGRLVRAAKVVVAKAPDPGSSSNGAS